MQPSFPDTSFSDFDIVWQTTRRANHELVMDFSHCQDVMASMPMLKRYMTLCLFFHSIAADFEPTDIASSLTAALSRLARAFPILTAQVVYEGRGDRSSGTVRIISYRDDIQLIVKDLRLQSDVPSMAEMRRAKYPFSMLPASALVSPIATSWVTAGFDEIAPVMILQANIINGGLVLSFACNHTVMDMTGMGMVMSWFAKACRDEPFTDEEIQHGNQDRRNAIPLLEPDWQPGAELDDCMTKPQSGVKESSESICSRWVYFNFDPTSLARLKDQASKQSIAPYISTDDAISALVWQAMSRARQHTLGRGASSQFCRDISIRKYLDMHTYMGNLTDCIYEHEVDVFERPLGEMAGRLRQQLFQNDKIVSHFRGLATLLSRLEDKSTLVYGANLEWGRDVIMSSYASVGCCEWSFGDVLGRPDAVRRPDGPAFVSGLSFVLPKSKDGGVAVGLTATDDEIERLREDPGFTSFAEYIG